MQFIHKPISNSSLLKLKDSMTLEIVLILLTSTQRKESIFSLQSPDFRKKWFNSIISEQMDSRKEILHFWSILGTLLWEIEFGLLQRTITLKFGARHLKSFHLPAKSSIPQSSQNKAKDSKIFHPQNKPIQMIKVIFQKILINVLHNILISTDHSDLQDTQAKLHVPLYLKMSTMLLLEVQIELSSCGVFD